jgi:hypothetical protein
MSVTGKISVILRFIAILIGMLSISISAFEYRIEDRIEDRLEVTAHQQNTDEKSDSDDSQNLYLPDYQATISYFQFHIINITNLLGHIPDLVLVKTWFQVGHPLTELNFFRTLFQHIISPNAP